MAKAGLAAELRPWLQPWLQPCKGPEAAAEPFKPAIRQFRKRIETSFGARKWPKPGLQRSAGLECSLGCSQPCVRIAALQRPGSWSGAFQACHPAVSKAYRNLVWQPCKGPEAAGRTWPQPGLLPPCKGNGRTPAVIPGAAPGICESSRTHSEGNLNWGRLASASLASFGDALSKHFLYSVDLKRVRSSYSRTSLCDLVAPILPRVYGPSHLS